MPDPVVRLVVWAGSAALVLWALTLVLWAASGLWHVVRRR